MPLKNTDGSVYRLKSPNPLMSNEKWANMILHNMRSTEQSLVEKAEIRPQKIEIKETPIDEFIPEIKPEIIVVKPPKPEKRSKLSNILLMHCLPANLEEKKSELYGDSYFTVKYGDKFTFEGIVVSRGDLVFEFWTTHELTLRSIIYPFRYEDNTPFNDFRWWKVNEIESKSDGWLIQAVFSDFQPDFTD